MIGKAKLSNGFYLLDVPEPTDAGFFIHITCASVTSQPSVVLWPNRLGHHFFSRLNSLKSTLHLPNFQHDHYAYWEICPLAKQRRLSFVSNNNFSPTTFNIVHADIWGPFSTPTCVGHSY